MQRTKPEPRGLHVGIIMDGNGRWARARGRTRSAGHRQGAEAVRRTVEAAPGLGIQILTLYAFSSDNWQRPPSEVQALMFLLEKFLVQERDRLTEKQVRLNVIGRRDRLRPSIVRAVEEVESATRGGSHLLLRVAIDYSAREAIARAALMTPSPGLEPQADFARRLEVATGSVHDVAPLDLVIRTGGEQRLSDFLLWESAYAELAFLSVLWPDFDAAHLGVAIADFVARDRRFGRLPAIAS